MTTELETDKQSYVIPAQTLRGSRQEILATIDQAIVGLLALRHLVAGESLVMPGADEIGTANPNRRGVPTSLTDVRRVFSNLMRKHE